MTAGSYPAKLCSLKFDLQHAIYHTSKPFCVLAVVCACDSTPLLKKPAAPHITFHRPKNYQ